MMLTKHAEMSEILDWFEKDHGDDDVFDIDMMLSWVSSDKRILDHSGLPWFIAFWCGTDISLLCEFANEFAHRWPDHQAIFDDLAKKTDFNIQCDCWVVYN